MFTIEYVLSTGYRGYYTVDSLKELDRILLLLDVDSTESIRYIAKGSHKVIKVK